MAMGNPIPGPLLPCTRGSPAATAASHDSYRLVVGDSTGIGVFVAVGAEVAVGTGMGVFVAVGAEVAVGTGMGVFVAVGAEVAVGTGVGVAVVVDVGVTEGSSSSSHTTPSPSPSRADGTMALGNPRPVPLLPCTRGSPAAEAASQDSYCLVVGDAMSMGVFVVMGTEVDLGMSIVVGVGTAVDCCGGGVAEGIDSSVVPSPHESADTVSAKPNVIHTRISHILFA